MGLLWSRSHVEVLLHMNGTVHIAGAYGREQNDLPGVDKS